MRRRRSNVAVCGPPDTVLVRYSGSDAFVSPVTYIVYLHGRVPEEYELWSLKYFLDYLLQFVKVPLSIYRMNIA